MVQAAQAAAAAAGVSGAYEAGHKTALHFVATRADPPPTHICVIQCCCRGDGVQAVAALAVMPALPGGGFADLFTNRVFLAGFWAWFCAQTLKVGTNHTAAAAAA
jgi:hypothetical protein